MTKEEFLEKWAWLPWKLEDAGWTSDNEYIVEELWEDAQQR